MKRAAALAGLLAAALVAALPGSAAGVPDLVPACTPELAYSLRPGQEMDAGSRGAGYAPNLLSTDAHGDPRPPSAARIEWSARAVVDESGRDTGVVPKIGGDLDLAIEIATGERVTFRATCIAASVGFPLGLVVYANGIVRGWPGAEARRALVHFEAYTDGSAYVALVDGADCELNHDARIVTDDPYVSGAAAFSGLPARLVFAETSCANRFGDPFPATRAPGQTP